MCRKKKRNGYSVFRIHFVAFRVAVRRCTNRFSLNALECFLEVFAASDRVRDALRFKYTVHGNSKCKKIIIPHCDTTKLENNDVFAFTRADSVLLLSRSVNYDENAARFSSCGQRLKV